MTDLNFSIDGHSADKIASYFSMSVEEVQKAIAEGAKTYQQIYDAKRTK